MRELFVYYRIRDTDAAAARAAVRAMQDGLRRAHPGLTARLLARADDGKDLQTWMETYSLASSEEGIAPALEAQIEAQATAWSHLLVGPRHIEAFAADD
jgi:Domain of unknown function (DUF4936)